MYTHNYMYNCPFVFFCAVGLDSSVGIATGYGLDGPGIKSRWRRDYPLPCSPLLRPTQPPTQWVKWPGRGCDHPHQSSAMLKKE